MIIVNRIGEVKSLMKFPDKISCIQHLYIRRQVTCLWFVKILSLGDFKHESYSDSLEGLGIN